METALVDDISRYDVAIVTWGGVINAATNTAAEKVSDNKIEVSDGSYTENGTAKTVSDTYGFFYGGGTETNTANSTGNSLYILSGNFNGIFAGMSASGSVFNNYLEINDGTINGGAVGGLAVWHSGYGVGDVYRNSVVVRGGTIGYVSGGEIAYSYLTGGSQPTDFSSALGNVYENNVLVEGSTVSNGIIGGSALGGSAFGNNIIITGGTVSGNIIGGSTQSGTAYNNTVTIEGNPDLSGATLWGGRIGSNPAYTGNTLNINTWGITARAVNGFENINFLLSNAGDGAALTLTNGATNFAGGLENISVATDGDSNIGTGSTFNILYNANGINLGNRTLLANSADSDSITFNSTLQRGVTFDYDLALSLSDDATTLTGTVGSNRGVNPDTATTTKAQLANVVTINNGTDAMAKGFDDFLGSNIAEDDDGYFLPDNPDGSNASYSDRAQKAEEVHEQHGFEIFGSANYGKLKTKTGDGGYIKTESRNFDLGLARTYEGAANRWTVAPVVEHGRGNYDALLPNGIMGVGDTEYTAGGLIARLLNRNGYYFETSARFGRSKNDFASDDFIVDDQPTHATYHTSAPIFAGHIRLGQARRLNRSNLLDLYGIYAYTRQGGSDTTLSTGEDYKFSSVSSSRFRLGYRLTTRTSRISRIYTGLAYQYEHTSDVTTKAFDVEGLAWNLPTAGSKGSSGMLELGWLIKPRNDNPWLVDINATGWVGHQKGATAMAKIKKSF